MTTIKQRARIRYSGFHGILSLSDLTMVHDIAGEVSPNVNEEMKEKIKLAKKMSLQCIDTELESLKKHWLGGMIYAGKIKSLKLERAEIETF